MYQMCHIADIDAEWKQEKILNCFRSEHSNTGEPPSPCITPSAVIRVCVCNVTILTDAGSFKPTVQGFHSWVSGISSSFSLWRCYCDMDESTFTNTTWRLSAFLGSICCVENACKSGGLELNPWTQYLNISWRWLEHMLDRIFFFFFLRQWNY